MRAAVCYQFGKPLVLEDILIEPPQRGEIRVRLGATAICHSDIHIIRGEWGGKLPVLAGHEAAGTVEEVGEGVSLARPGDRVVVSLLRSCGRCFFCVTGKPYLCEASFALDVESRLKNRQGIALNRGLRTAAFAEQVVVDQSQVAPIPAELPFDRAALLACGVVTGVGAVVNTARVEPGSSVVVIGTGGVGLNAVQGARIAGAHQIIAIDVSRSKLDKARDFGATHAVEAGEAAPGAVMELTSGRGAGYVFATVGRKDAIMDGFKMTRKGGTLVIVGQPPVSEIVSFSVDQWIKGERRVIGSPMGSTRLRVDVPWLASLYLEGRLKLDELVTARFPFVKINDAIEDTEKGESIRNVLLLE